MCCFEAVKLVLLLFLQLTSKKKNMMQEPVEYSVCMSITSTLAPWVHAYNGWIVSAVTKEIRVCQTCPAVWSSRVKAHNSSEEFSLSSLKNSVPKCTLWSSKRGFFNEAFVSVHNWVLHNWDFPILLSTRPKSIKPPNKGIAFCTLIKGQVLASP